MGLGEPSDPLDGGREQDPEPTTVSSKGSLRRKIEERIRPCPMHSAYRDTTILPGPMIVTIAHKAAAMRQGQKSGTPSIAPEGVHRRLPRAPR